MLGPLTNAEIVSRSATTPAAGSRSFFLIIQYCSFGSRNLGVWVLQSDDSITIEDLDPLLKSVEQLLVDAAEGISKVINVDEDDSNCDLPSNLSPVLSCKLTKIDMRMFARLIQNHCLHLVTHFNDSGLEQISQEFYEFQHAFCEKVEFKETIKLIDSDAASMDFKLLWLPANNCLPQLPSICGGLTSAFPNIATVGSDFSIIEWEKSDYQHDLADFSLEEILHTK